MVLCSSRNREYFHVLIVVFPTFNTGILKNHGAINRVNGESQFSILDPSISDPSLLIQLFSSVKIIVEGYF